jgi:outer membrane protein insertion porin family
MKRISGNMLALIGLILGLASGLGVITLKRYLIQEIVQALNEEVVASCKTCSLSYDSFALSFLTLSGKVTEVRLLDNGVPKLTFDKITATFSINEIFEQKIYLETLILSNGHAEGVGPDSPTFRFIEQITSPLPPELANKPRWRAILNNLEIRTTSLRESFGTSELYGQNLSLFVKRIGEEFVILPELKDLRYRSFLNDKKSEVTELPLGQLTGSIVIQDNQAVFNSLKVGRDVSEVAIKGAADTAHGDALSGSASYMVDAQYVGIPSWLQGLLVGNGQLKGSLGSPIIEGSLSHSESAPLTLAFPHASPVKLSSIQGDLSVDVNHGDPIVTLRNISGAGERSKVTGTHPLVFSDKGLSAGFDVALPSFTYGPFSVHEASANITVKPSGRDTITTFVVQAADLKVQGTSLGPVKLNLALEPKGIIVKVDSTDSRYGSFRWEGFIDTTASEPFLKDGKLALENYRYPQSSPPDPSRLSPIQLTTFIPLSGPLDLGKLTGEGPTTVTIPNVGPGISVSGKASLKDGNLLVHLPTSPQGASINLKLDVARAFNGKLQIALPSVPLSRFVQEANCGVIDASLDYNFSLSAPLGGSGNVVLGDLHVGCEPYVLRLPKNTTLPISVGALRFKNTRFSSGNTALVLDGSLGFESGFDVSLSGDLHLSSLLPLLPSVDNLRGLLSTKVAIKGPIGAPRFTGTAALSDGELAVPSPDIGAHDVKGRFVLAEDTIKIENLTGSVNSGSFVIQGNLVPFNWPSSRMTAELKEVTVEPATDASITFSGHLALGLNQDKHQALSGDIGIDFAEISKDFDLNKILVQTIKGYFIPARVQPQISKKPVSLDLDVRFSAPRNIFVLTPFFSAELNANIHAGGTTADPGLQGSMQLLSGWVGLKGNRFDITSGILTFKPGSLTPSVEIASEGNLRAPTGESVLVILEASGPLTSPRISLSSDRGLSQEDLLLLITSSRSLTGRTMANRVGNQFARDQRYFLSEDSFSSFEAFFRNLTKIDTLSFEPTYNPYTGLVEPAIMAKKSLTPRFAFVGNSLFSSVSNSKAGVVYNLTPTLDINGFIQSVSTQENIILSSDLTYTIFAEQAVLVDITVKGTDQTDEQDILNAARIGSESRIPNNPESLATIQRNILGYLHDQGFLGATAEITCPQADLFCKQLLITLHEGDPFTIRDIRVEGDSLPPDLNSDISSVAERGTTALGSVKQKVERELVIKLRSEGYIAARITPEYMPTDQSNKVDLVIKSDLREPISFVFSGNTVFTDEQFLDSIELFSRKRPFGNNTVKLLVQNIEQMYQASGYLFAQASYSEDRANLDRLTYKITIAEETRTKVRELKLVGNDSLSEKKIKKTMRELGLTEQVELLNPTYAIPAQLDTLETILETVYQQQGFPNAQVSYTLEPVKNDAALDITYRLIEGEPLRVQSISVKGFPSDVTIRAAPPAPFSLPVINQYIEHIVAQLEEEGFMTPTIDVEPSADTSHIDLRVESGPRTIISSVTIEGLSLIEESVARKYILLETGKPFRTEDVNATKRELLRSGLFSRVEVMASDGAFDKQKEEITVRLAERALETLEVGTGANSEFGLHVFGEAVDKSFFADGRTISTRVDTYFDQARLNPDGSSAISQGFANIRYMDPFFLESEYALTEELRFQRQELSTQEFNLDRMTFASYIFRQFNSRITFTGGHSLTLDNLNDVNPGAIITPLDEGHVRLSFLSGLLKFDTRDDPLTPHKGYTVTVEPRLSFQQIGSEANFAGILSKATGIIPLERVLSPRFSLGLGLSGGIAQPWADTVGIPITQRFYLGGRTTVRGFKENSLGPLGDDGAVIGGDTLLMEKNQFQYLITDSFSTHTFIDVGNVYLRHESFDLANLRSSTGFGFQYISPIGPIGFDVGYPLDRKPNEDVYRIHFSVGSAF